MVRGNGSTEYVGLIEGTALAAGMAPAEYNEIALTYNGAGDIATVTYKQAGVTVGVLTLGYTGANLTSVVRT